MAVLALVSCFEEDAPSDTTVPDERGPLEVVAALMTAMEQGRFEDTGALTDTTQAALLTLVEGADASEVTGAIEGGADDVAANFWSGFAQTSEQTIDADQMAVEAAEPVSQGGSQFVEVSVTPPEGEARIFVVRRDGSWKIDLFATFGPVLAERMIPRVESVLSSANADASMVLADLADSADSLQMAAANPDLPPATHQAILALIERVTRAKG